jgi:hypothetical protein
MKEKLNTMLALLKVAFFFPLCWVIGGTFTGVIVGMLGAPFPWPPIVYFIVGILGTVWFIKS